MKKDDIIYQLEELLTKLKDEHTHVLNISFSNEKEVVEIAEAGQEYREFLRTGKQDYDIRISLHTK